MAINPSYTKTGGANKATAPKASQNVEHVVVPKTHNSFDRTHTFFTTEEYGSYNPFYIEEVTAGDYAPINPRCEVRSESFNTPLMTPIKKAYDLFYVPFFAILPRTWEYIYTNPTQGDDVPEDAFCFIPNFKSLLSELLESWIATIHKNVDTNSFQDTLKLFTLFIFTYEMFCSTGSLLFRMKYKLNPQVIFTSGVYTGAMTSDKYIDTVLSAIADSVYVIVNFGTANSRTFFSNEKAVEGALFSNMSKVTKGELVSILRQSYSMPKTFVGTKLTETNSQELFDEISDLSAASFNFGTSGTANDTEFNYNFAPQIAYNLAVSQYYNNPSVDYIYSAELYSQAVFGLMIDNGILSLEDLTFTRNGHTVYYDIFSGHFIKKLFEFAIRTVSDNTILSNQYKSVISIFANIWSIQNSLKYGDYFVGSKPRALAVGETTIPVANGSVDSVEVARQLLMTKYLHACNKLSSDFESQFETMTGQKVPPDYHYPHFIQHSEQNISGYEVSDTTSANLGNQITRMNSTGDGVKATISIDLPGYVLGISSFYMSRTYCRTKDRMYFRSNRFDFFQPMLQNLGDQEVFQLERDDFNVGTFGYHGRNEEYKQTYNHAAGAFCDILRSWAYIADDANSLGYKLDKGLTISPEYIRCNPAEFDRFLPVTPYYSLGHKFHFICRYDINQTYNRPMIQSPTIL